MKKKSLILSTGLAMFSMFFGSGNLVFPTMVGQLSEGHTFLASCGILFTGVIVPFLGILGIFLYNGDTNNFFSRLGRHVPFWFTFFALGIMGPFGVLARCITVAHGAYRQIFPGSELWIFSLVACILLFGLTIRKNRIVPLLGSVLTPLLLLSLGAIAVFGLSGASLPIPSLEGGWDSFKTGIFQGYQTMDLLAAFFFSAFVINHLKQKSPDASLPVFLKSSLIGAGLLSTIYVILVLMGSMYAKELQGIPDEQLFGHIATLVLGPYAAPVVCVAVVLACVTTAIVLTSLFSDFLRKEVSRDKLPHAASLAITLGIGFSISTLGFWGIKQFIGPILEIIYPALIVLTVLNIASSTLGWTATYKARTWLTVRLPTIGVLTWKFLTTHIIK